MSKEIQTSDENQTIEAGSAFSNNLLGKNLSRSIVIFLEGNLGAGKTTFTKGLMKGLGYEELVKSPTYNLVEIHETESLKVFHFDLYRINNPHELEEIGIGEYLDEKNSICIFEWPENAQSLLPQPDYTIEIEHSDDTQLDRRNIRINA
jgi:tRNA threonylcarbamoyladenosine biosynthesis protein TsaE|tara:strand:- start:2225 stop:2671 length:447 start_codon:yes stop_codon:yes gene_type:complete